MKRTLTSILALLLGFTGLAHGDGDAGYTSANFLKIGMGARAAGMADSFTSVADDATAIYWNPAGLYQVKGMDISLTYSQWIQGVDLEYIALSQSLGEQGTIGLSFATLGVQSFLSTIENSSGNYAGTGAQVTANDFNFSGAYSNRLSNLVPEEFLKNTLIGVSANMVGQNEDGPTGNALFFDVGALQLFPKDHVSVGFDVINIGTSIQDRSLPLDVKLGASWYHLANFTAGDRLTLAADADVYTDTGFQPSFGTEYRLPVDRMDTVSLRGGLETSDQLYGLSFFTLGAGLEHDFNGFIGDFDYAFAPYGTLGPTNRFSLGIKMGRTENLLKADLAGPTRFNLDSPSVPLALKSESDETVTQWTLLLADDKGNLVQEVDGKGNPPASYDWNAEDSKGQLVAPGTYVAMLKVKDVDDHMAQTAPVSFLAVAPLSLDHLQWSLASDSLFDVAKAEIKEAGRVQLAALGKDLLKYFGDIAIEIQGHTDNKPCHIGPHCKFHDNQELSEARAQAVKDLFLSMGLKAQNITIVGLADKEPVAPNETVEGRAKNRRIQVAIKSTRIETPESVSNAGIFLMNNGQADQAVQLFKMVVDHNPDKPEAYRLLASCYMKMGNMEEAQKVQQEALALTAPAPQKAAPGK